MLTTFFCEMVCGYLPFFVDGMDQVNVFEVIIHEQYMYDFSGSNVCEVIGRWVALQGPFQRNPEDYPAVKKMKEIGNPCEYSIPKI